MNFLNAVEMGEVRAVVHFRITIESEKLAGQG